MGLNGLKLNVGGPLGANALLLFLFFVQLIKKETKLNSKFITFLLFLSSSSTNSGEFYWSKIMSFG